MIAKYIKRDIYKELWNDIDKKEMAFLLGPRQAGKTTLMRNLQTELEKKNEKTVFLSLDFEPDSKYFSSQQYLMRKIKLEIGEKKGYVFIDEIQRKENAGIFLKGIYDLNLPYKFILSGSGSVDLKSKIKESLVGRKREYEIFTVSLKEFINFKTQYKYESNLEEFFKLEAESLNELLLEYLNFGGYPRVVLETELREKTKIIDEIYQGYIEKDISYFLNVEKIEAFRLLIKVLADQMGKLLNYSEISNTLGISLPTVKNYLWYAENTYVLQRISPFFRNARTEISKSPVIYFVDNGLRNYALGIFGKLERPDDLGFSFQNLVYQIMEERLRFTNNKIHYWRTKSGAEIDLIIDFGRNVIPMEIKYADMNKPVIPRSFYGFIDKYSPEKCFVINKNLKISLKINQSKILFMSVFDLLFENIDE